MDNLISDEESHAIAFENLVTPESDMLAKEAAKESAKQKLQALGLTEEEVLAFIGG